MAKTKKMTDEDIVGELSNYISDSLSYNQSELAEQRADSLSYYLGNPFGNEIEGKSQVVTRDVQETVDWIMPSLMKVFTGGDTVVQFTPQNADDVPLAEQETEYINYLFLRRNPGVEIMYDWFQDALINKNGIVKVYVEETSTPKYDYYLGLNDQQVVEILSDPEAELIEKTEVEGAYDIKVRTTKTKRDIKVCNVPPEEFVINKEARSIAESTFVAHRPKVTKSDLYKMGVPEKDIEEKIQFDSYDFLDSTPELLVRSNIDGTGAPDPLTTTSGGNETTRLTECFINLDVDGDGIAELRRIVLIGDNYLWENEEASCKPFASICANRIAHKFFGMSVYDKIKDLQEIRSVLMRNILDNVYNLNNGRYGVVEGQVNLDDLMTNQSGGVVRLKAINALSPLPVPALGGDVYNMLDRLEAERAKRTGVSDTSRGLDEGTLHSNQAASAVTQVMTASEQQIELLARMFAETGVKNLFQLLHDFAIRFQDQEEVFQLRGQFISVNPANWRDRTDLTVTVGIGNMNKDQQLAHLMRMFEIAQTVVNNGGMGILVSEKNIYNMLKEMTINAGYKDVTRYWTDPDSPESKQTKQAQSEQQSPEDKLAEAEKIKAQSDAAEKQAKTELEAAKLELEKEKIALLNREMSLKEAQQELERNKFEWEMAKNEAEYNLESEQNRAAAIGDLQTPMVGSVR